MQTVKKRVDPNKIFFKFRCMECNYSVEQPIAESAEVGDPICGNDEHHEMEYLYTFMIVKKDIQQPKKIRTKNTPLSKLEQSRIQYLLSKEKKQKKTKK